MRTAFTVIAVTILALGLTACGGSAAEPSAPPTESSSIDNTGTELVRLSLEGGSNGEPKTTISEPFTTSGGPLMVEVVVTEWGDYQYLGIEGTGWNGVCNLMLLHPDSYFEEGANPIWSPSFQEGVDKYRGQVFTPDEQLVPAGTWEAHWELQNIKADVRLVQLPL